MRDQTAANRTRMVKRAISDAGYTAKVTSTPGIALAQMTTVMRSDHLDDIAVYLRGYLGADADVTLFDSGFISIGWANAS